jgi:hypothetical protein
MRKRSLGVTLVAIAVSVPLLMPTAAGSATPKPGKYTGKTAASEKKIRMTVKDNRTKATVHFCGYAMGTTVNDAGKFTAKHTGPGGTYVAVKGEFVTRRKAKGTVTIDFLCNTEGEAFTLRHV